MRSHGSGTAARCAVVVRFVRLHGLWLLVAVVTAAVVIIVGSLLRDGPDDGWAPKHPKAAADFCAPDAWLGVAEGFGRAFTRTSLGQEAWFFALSSWMTDEQAQMYRDVAITQIPAGVLEDADIIAPDGRRTTSGLLTYDTGLVLDVRLVYVKAEGGWLIATVTPAPAEPR